MEFVKLYNFTPVDSDETTEQVMFKHEVSPNDLAPDLIVIETVHVNGRAWSVEIPFYSQKAYCRAYFEAIDDDAARFWKAFFRRQTTTPIDLRKVKFLLMDDNDASYLPWLLDSFGQEYDIEQVIGDVNVGGIDVAWRDDGGYWQIKEVEAVEMIGKREEFVLQVEGEVVDSYVVDHIARRTTDLLFATLQIEIQKVAYIMAQDQEREEELDTM